MQGFIGRAIPLALRRLVTMAPALVVLAIGLDPSRSLVISQVVLSFGSRSRWFRSCSSRGGATSWASWSTAG